MGYYAPCTSTGSRAWPKKTPSNDRATGGQWHIQNSPPSARQQQANAAPSSGPHQRQERCDDVVQSVHASALWPARDATCPPALPTARTTVFAARLTINPTYVGRERKPEHVFFIGKHRVLRSRHHHHPPEPERHEKKRGGTTFGGANIRSRASVRTQPPPLPLSVDVCHTGSGGRQGRERTLSTTRAAQHKHTVEKKWAGTLTQLSSRQITERPHKQEKRRKPNVQVEPLRRRHGHARHGRFGAQPLVQLFSEPPPRNG